MGKSRDIWTSRNAQYGDRMWPDYVVLFLIICGYTHHFWQFYDNSLYFIVAWKDTT